MNSPAYDELVVRVELLSAAIDEAAEGGTAPSEENLQDLKALLTLERNKIDALGHVLLSLAGQAEHCANHAAALKARADRFMKRRARLETYILAVMLASGKRKAEGDLVTLTLLNGRERVEIPDPEGFCLTCGDKFIRMIPASLEPEKIAIRDALKRGEEVPGAALVMGDPSLRVYR